MAHAKQQIRAAFVTRLAGLATTGSTVYSARAHNHNTVPSLNILAGDEDAEALSNDGSQIRRLEILVEVRSQKADAEDEADQIQAEAEAAVHASGGGGLAFNLDNQVVHCEFRSASDQWDDEAKNKTLLRTLTFECVYIIDPTDPETLIN